MTRGRSVSDPDAPPTELGPATGAGVVVCVDPELPDAGVLARAGQLIRQGRLVAFPTETVYGLGANALDDAAVRRVFAAKGRAASDPLIVHLAAAEALREVTAGSRHTQGGARRSSSAGTGLDSPGRGTIFPGDVPFEELVRLLAGHFWPGPLTLVLPKSDRIPDSVTAGLPTVAVRVPRHPVAQGLLRAAGVPIAAPSANTFTRTSATAAAHVLEDLGGRVDLILDGGPAPIGIESTVVQVQGDSVRLLRPGAVSVEAIDRVLAQGGWPAVVAPQGASMGRAGEATGAAPPSPPLPLASPGMLEKHYAPRARLLFFSGPPEAARAAMRRAAGEALAAGQRVGLLLCQEDAALFHDLAGGVARGGSAEPAAGGVADGADVIMEDLGPCADLAVVGQRLFDAMRRLDARGADTICARSLPTTGLGLAIDDRLTRAAGGRVVRAG